jgi:hypothetical protein
MGGGAGEHKKSQSPSQGTAASDNIRADYLASPAIPFGELIRIPDDVMVE